jgi:hypothetical protein
MGFLDSDAAGVMPLCRHACTAGASWPVVEQRAWGEAPVLVHGIPAGANLIVVSRNTGDEYRPDMKEERTRWFQRYLPTSQ